MTGGGWCSVMIVLRRTRRVYWGRGTLEERLLWRWRGGWLIRSGYWTKDRASNWEKKGCLFFPLVDVDEDAYA